METDKKLIWAYLSMKRQNLDDDYYFYEDGTILHHYDQTIMKLDIEEYISPNDITDYDKNRILSKCKDECANSIFEAVNDMLNPQTAH